MWEQIGRLHYFPFSCLLSTNIEVESDSERETVLSVGKEIFPLQL
jgi:hypothetical protein